VSRQPPASSSAARRKTAARSLNGSARHPGAARFAAATAAWASAWVALPATPSTWLCRCGCTTSIRSPPPIRRAPSIVMVSSSRSPASASSRACSEARSGLPGA
jgi:hypothetical protein